MYNHNAYTFAGTLTVLVLILLTYLVPDARTKPDHTRVIKVVPVSYNIIYMVLKIPVTTLKHDCVPKHSQVLCIIVFIVMSILY